jgi:hypothetical protein
MNHAQHGWPSYEDFSYMRIEKHKQEHKTTQSEFANVNEV